MLRVLQYGDEEGIRKAQLRRIQDGCRVAGSSIHCSQTWTGLAAKQQSNQLENPAEYE